MRAEDQELLRSLLVDQRLLSLSLVSNAEPVAGLLPFVVAEDYGAVCVQASKLSAHGQAMEAGAPFSAVVHRPDGPDVDPLQVLRVVFQGTVEPLGRERSELEGAIRRFVGRFPGAASTLALADFTLYRLEIRAGRLVAGFGRAVNLTAEHFRALRPE